jgi:multicomponent Na+:H+ antiporter subunit D
VAWASLLPLAVALPLLVAGLMLIVAHELPARVPDAVAAAVALAVAGLCAALAVRAADAGPVTYWFGGWVPRDGLILGIGFTADGASAAVAALIGVVFAAAFVFAWGYFDEVHAHFHVLMLLFLAGMVGFCLTHDLFNLFVWFEVMSIAAFALTGFRLEASALEGALDFTVTSAIGSSLMLGGIGLVYSRAGTLDFTALGRAVAAGGDDPVILGAFCLIAAALLIKGAAVPFHFWLADAHSVAPSPVSVIFSGAMVALGVFGIAKLERQVFAGSPAVGAVVRTVVLWLGAASVLVGGVMCLSQRHIKRLLAFSTISHVGIMLIGASLFAPAGTAGMLVYLAGHGLVKGALFMVAGILLAMLGGIDEIGLRGRGRQVWPAGVAMAVGGLLLAGVPFGLMDEGVRQVGDAAGHVRGAARWAALAVPVGAVLTGGAVLRVVGRVFLGLGATPGEEERAPTEEEQEKADRPLPLMLAPCAALLLASLLPGDLARRFAERAVPAFVHAGGAVPLPKHAAHPWLPWITTALAVLVALFDLVRGELPAAVVRTTDRVTGAPLDWLRDLHSGIIGDYAAWIAAGLALLAAGFALT